MAGGRFLEARQEFEAAISGGYRAANIDLGQLLTQPSAAMLDVPKALSLFEKAWKEGVAIAAFELGSLYEHGVFAAGQDNLVALAPDAARAWAWYQKGAETGEPNALARFAEREDAAAYVESDPKKKNQLLLDTFKYYASAVERARYEGWPDSASRSWRYRRASLARLLERDGMTAQVADTYDSIRKQYAPTARTMWEQIKSWPSAD